MKQTMRNELFAPALAAGLVAVPRVPCQNGPRCKKAEPMRRQLKMLECAGEMMTRE